MPQSAQRLLVVKGRESTWSLVLVMRKEETDPPTELNKFVPDPLFIRSRIKSFSSDLLIPCHATNAQSFELPLSADSLFCSFGFLLLHTPTENNGQKQKQQPTDDNLSVSLNIQPLCVVAILEQCMRRDYYSEIRCSWFAIQFIRNYVLQNWFKATTWPSNKEGKM